VGGRPWNLAVDVYNQIWVTNSQTNYVTKLSNAGTILSSTPVGSSPYGIALDSSGHAWVANYASNSVSKLSNSGALLGTFSVNANPWGVAIDSSGNIWVTNAGSSTVTLLTSLGTVVGAYAAGTMPTCISIDSSSGNIWIANHVNNGGSVTKLSSMGVMLSIYDVGSSPYGIGIAANGEKIWVANNGANTVSTLSFSVQTLAPTSMSTILSSSTVTVGSNPFGLAIGQDGIYVCSGNNAGSVSRISASTGTVLSSFSAGSYPQSLAFDLSGNLWVGDYVYGYVYKYTTSGSELTSYYIGGGPWQVVTDSSQDAWVSVYNTGRVVKLSDSGLFLGSYTVGTNPQGIAIDSQGNAWVCNYGSGTVMKLSGTSIGAVLGTYAVGGHPWGIALSATTGYIYVSNRNGWVNVLSTLGQVLLTFEAGGVAPTGIALDAYDNIWVANNINSGTVSKLSSAGVQLNTYSVGVLPVAIVVDTQGDVYVSNNGDDTVTILKFLPDATSAPTPATTVTTVYSLSGGGDEVGWTFAAGLDHTVWSLGRASYFESSEWVPLNSNGSLNNASCPFSDTYFWVEGIMVMKNWKEKNATSCNGLPQYAVGFTGNSIYAVGAQFTAPVAGTYNLSLVLGPVLPKTYLVYLYVKDALYYSAVGLQTSDHEYEVRQNMTTNSSIHRFSGNVSLIVGDQVYVLVGDCPLNIDQCLAQVNLTLSITTDIYPPNPVLSLGAIVGIVVGCGLGVSAFLALLICQICKRRASTLSGAPVASTFRPPVAPLYDASVPVAQVAFSNHPAEAVVATTSPALLVVNANNAFSNHFIAETPRTHADVVVVENGAAQPKLLHFNSATGMFE